MANLDKDKMLKAWADIVIKRWELKISQLDVVSKGENAGTLLKSFHKQVSLDANGNSSKITFTFAYYGRFAELAVGKGVKAGMSSNRKKKPWYTKVFFGQVNKLSEIMAKDYGTHAVISIIENIELVNI